MPPVSVKPSVPDVTILFDAHDALSLPSSNYNQPQVNGQRHGNMQQPVMNGSNAYTYDEQPRQQQQQPTGYRLPQQQMMSSTNQQPSYQNGDGNGVYYGSAEQQNAGGIYAAYANSVNGSGNPQQYRGNAAMPQQRPRAPAPGMVTTSGHLVTRASGVPPQRLAGVYDTQQQQQQLHPQYAGNIAHQQPMMRLEQGGDGRNIRQQQPHAMMAGSQWQQQQRQQALVSNYNGMMPTQSQLQRFPGEYVANRYSGPHQMRLARPAGPQGQGYSMNPPAHRPGIMKHATGGVVMSQDNYSANNNVAVPLNVKPTAHSPTAVIHQIAQSESDVVNGTTQQLLSPVSEKSGGSQVSSSSNTTTSPSAAVSADAAVAALSPPQVIQLLQHQEEQLRMLREQVALLLSKQDAREEAAVVSATKSADNKENREPVKIDVAVAATDNSISIGNNAKSASTQGVVSSVSRHNCSKAVNTSAWLNSIPTPAAASSATSQTPKKHHSKHRHHRREKAASALDSSSATEYDQGPREHRTKTKARRSGDDISWTSYATNEVETGQSSTAEDASGEADDTLSLSRSQIEMKVNRNNDDVSVASEIIVDLPAVSLSPEK